MLRQQEQQQSSHLRSMSRSPAPPARPDSKENDAWTKTAPLKYPFCAEEDALEKLQQWLDTHDWNDLQAHLLDAGYTRYEKYSQIEPQMLALDEAAGLYLYRGKILQLVGPDR
jgi:hypothetical protein